MVLMLFRSFAYLFVVLFSAVDAVILNFQKPSIQQGEEILVNWIIEATDPSKFELWLVGPGDFIIYTLNVTSRGRTDGSTSFGQGDLDPGQYECDAISGDSLIGETGKKLTISSPSSQNPSPGSTTSKVTKTPTSTVNSSGPTTSSSDKTGSTISTTEGATQTTSPPHTSPLSNHLILSTTSTTTSPEMTSDTMSSSTNSTTYSWSNPTPSSDQEPPKLNAKLIVPIVVPTTLAMLILIVLVICMKRRASSRKLQSSSDDSESSLQQPEPLQAPPSAGNNRLLEELQWWRTRFGSDWPDAETGGGAPPNYPGPSHSVESEEDSMHRK